MITCSSFLHRAYSARKHEVMGSKRRFCCWKVVLAPQTTTSNVNKTTALLRCVYSPHFILRRFSESVNTPKETGSRTYYIEHCLWFFGYVDEWMNVLYIDLKGKVHPRTNHEGPEGKWRYSSTLSLTSTLDGMRGQCHAPAALPPGKRLDTFYIGGWVGPRARLDACEKPRPYQDSIPGPSSP
jgi:hypothetical protein